MSEKRLSQSPSISKAPGYYLLSSISKAPGYYGHPYLHSALPLMRMSVIRGSSVVAGALLSRLWSSRATPCTAQYQASVVAWQCVITWLLLSYALLSHTSPLSLTRLAVALPQTRCTRWPDPGSRSICQAPSSSAVALFGMGRTSSWVTRASMPVPTGGPCRVASLGGTCRATDIPVTLAIVVCGNAPDLWVISHTWSSSNREVLFEAITLSVSARTGCLRSCCSQTRPWCLCSLMLTLAVQATGVP